MRAAARSTGWRSIWRSMIASALSSRRRAAGTTAESAWSTTTTGATPWTMSAGFELGWHSFFLVQLRNGNHQDAILAFSGNDDLFVFAAFEGGIECVEAQTGFWSFAGVASEAGAFEHGSDVLGIGEAIFFCWWRKFAEIDLTSDGRSSSHKQA